MAGLGKLFVQTVGSVFVVMVGAVIAAKGAEVTLRFIFPDKESQKVPVA